MALAQLNVTLGLQIQSFQRSLNRLERDINRFQRRFETIGTNLTQSISLPLAALAGSAVTAFGEFESLERAFAAVAAEGTNVSEEIERLRKIAQAPGLGFSQAVQASTRLQAVGLSAGQAARVVEQFGNAVARSGGGAESLDGAVLALTQIASKGKISAEEINQLSERIFEIRPALQAAFGTADSEQLQKLGISAEEFIARTTEELAKLERVNGGLANSFENFRDSARQALTDIGREISKAIDLPAILDRISLALENAANFFRNLSPEAKRMAINIGLVAIAIGPLLLLIAKLASVFTVAVSGAKLLLTGVKGLASALIFLTTPAGIAVAAIAAIVGVIALASSKLKTYKKDNDELTESAKTATQQVVKEKNEFNTLVDTLKRANISSETRAKLIQELNSKYGTYLPQLVTEKTTLKELEIAQNAANKAFADRITLLAFQSKFEKLNEQIVKTKEEELNLQLSLTNAQKNQQEGVQGIITTNARAAKAAQNALAGGVFLVEKSIADNIEQQKRLQQELENTKKLAKDLGVNLLSPSAGSTTAFGLSGFERAQGGGAGAVLDPALSKAQQLKDTFDNALTKFIASIKTVSSGRVGLLDLGLSTPIINEQKDALLEYEKSLKSINETAAVFGTNPLEETFRATEAALKAAIAQFGPASEAVRILREEYDKLKVTTNEVVDAFNKAITGAINESLNSLAFSFGEFFGQLAAGSTTLRNFAVSLLGGVADALIQFGKLAIAAGIAAEGIKRALQTLNPVAAIAGGVALVALGTFVKSQSAKLTKLAKGGLAFGPTLAVVGDNPAARTDPEVIAPLSRLRDMLGGSMGGGFVAEARISGSDLALLVSRANLRNERIR